MPGEITDEDRLRALIAFIEKLKITNPPGVAEIRRALFDDLGSRCPLRTAPSFT